MFAATIVAGLLTLSAEASTLAAPAEPRSVAGRTLDAVLRDFAKHGVNIVFSSNLVDPAWVVGAEPLSTALLERLRELLAPFGLNVRQVSASVMVVVRANSDLQITGRVVDGVSGRPLVSARVLLSPGRVTVKTDQRGRFVFNHLRSGRYHLVASLLDFHDSEAAELLLPEVQVPLTIALAPDTTLISEIVVSVSRYQFGGTDLMREAVLRHSDLQGEPGLREDALRATARIPGFAQSDLSSAAYVRGGDSDEILVQLDGVQIRQPFHFPGYQSVFSTIDPAIVSRMEVFTGGFPARYGDRMSAVFDINTEQEPKKVERELGLSVFNASARAAGPLPGTTRWDGIGVVRLGALHYLLNTFAPNTTNPSYQDGFGRLHFAASGNTDLYGYALAAQDELRVVDPDRGERGHIDSQSAYAWIKASHRWSGDARGAAWFAYSRINSQRIGALDNARVGSGLVQDVRRSTIWDAHGEWQWLISAQHQIEATAQASYGQSDYRYANSVSFEPDVAALFSVPSRQASSILVSPQRRSLAASFTHRWRISPTVSSEIGVRTQRESGLGLEPDVALDPRVALRWSPAPETQVRLAWGLFHQADEVFQLRVEDGLTAFEAAQQSEHLILGLDHRLSDGTLLRLEGFRKTQTDPRTRFENLINPLAYFSALAPDRIRIAPQRAELRGIEASAEQRGEPWSWWASYTYAEAVDEIGAREVVRSWDQRHSVNLGVEWTSGKWNLSASARGHSGWHTTPVITSVSGGSVLGVRNSQSLPAFATLDLQLARRWQVSPGEITLAFELTNATNRNNVCCRDLSTINAADGSLQFTTEATSWLPLLPSLSVHWRF